jgi:CheY-like chemotaxis protein
MAACRILHVEDEPDIREVVKFSLSLDPEISVKSCDSGRDALAEAAHWSPDLILLDVVMPELDGLELLTRLKSDARTARIPVVFMTARAQRSEIEHFLSLGAAGVVAKPFDPLTLAKSVRACLARRAPGRLTTSK